MSTTTTATPRRRSREIDAKIQQMHDNEPGWRDNLAEFMRRIAEIERKQAASGISADGSERYDTN